MDASEKELLLPRPYKASPKEKERFVLVIHGGAGTMLREGSTPEQRKRYHSALREALRVGHEVLKQGGEAMDAAVAAVSSMEDCPLFNCAKGAVFNVAGKNELEASVMLSKPPSTHPQILPNRRGASLTLLTRTRNPSQAVRSLYLSPSSTPHPFLSGEAAETIASSLGTELVDTSYFFTEARWKEHRRGLGLPEELPSQNSKELNGRTPDIPLDQLPTGTVGAVALDIRGCIASVTSTGGRTNKLVGRIGDTPHMGAGFWAEEWVTKGWRKCVSKLFKRSVHRAMGVSGTGDGDYFIRYNTAAGLMYRMKFRNKGVRTAAKSVVEELRRNGGLGGVIAVDDRGNYALELNSSGMYRGVIREDGKPKTAIFHDDVLE